MKKEREFLYLWAKRYEQQWTWVTLTVDDETKQISLYINGRKSDARFGTGVTSPLEYAGFLKRYGVEPYFIGTTTSVGVDEVNRWFKGDIAKIMMWDRCLEENEIMEFPVDMVAHYDFNEINENILTDLTDNGNHGEIYDVEIKEEKNLKIHHTILPFRRDGKFECLPHQTEGLINVGGSDKWAKGETTAANERRYVLEMQQGRIDYKTDGLNTMEYELVSIETIFDRHKMINVKA